MRFRPVVAGLSFALAAASTAQAQVYQNNFNSSIGPALSVNNGGVLALITSPNATAKFLGLTAGAFDNHTLTLSLSGLQGHTGALVSFRFLALESWDGNGNYCCGPDIFNVSVDGNPLLNATFDNTGYSYQTYPANYPGANNASRGGASASNTLGYSPWGDATYDLSFGISHTSSNMTLTFTGSNLQGWGDEGWGIDDLRVDLRGTSTVPEPSTWALMATGLGALLLVTKRRKV